MVKKRKSFGKAFAGELSRVTYRNRHFLGKNEGHDINDLFIPGSNEETESSTSSSWIKFILPICFLIIFGLFLLRLVHLQIIQGADNRELADTNRIQVKLIHAPRGVIYDRNGKILAQDEPGFRYTESTTSGKPKTFYISRDDALKLEVGKDPRFKNLEVDNIRTYPYGEKTAHILGYVSEITEDELKDPSYTNTSENTNFSLTGPMATLLGQTKAPYKGGDKIGRIGIEETYEKALRGIDGGEVIEIDAAGNKKRTLRHVDPIPGQNVYLTIDADMQQVAYDQLLKAAQTSKSCCGAAVVQDPTNGEILALASIPSFDPKHIEPALVAPDSPFLDRVISGTYPPGSTFKIATSMAGLSSGKITGATSFADTGVMSIGPYTFANWYYSEYGRKEDGMIDVIRALKRSNDIYFYQVGQTIGEKTIGDVSKEMGLGRKLGIDLPGEAAGLIPDNDWKVKNVGDVWYPGDTLHMSIGQGYVLTTPLQISNLVSQIADNGKYYSPHLLKKITSSTGKLVKNASFENISKTNFKQSDIDLVKKGLNEVPVSGGTAWPFFTFPVPTAGKTGTAEYGAATNASGQPIYKTHAWYTSYAPLDNPQLAVTVLVEGGGEGSTVASPVAKEVYRWYFSQDKKNLLKDITSIATDSGRSLGE
jgi:penicillin-binding protein 2